MNLNRFIFVTALLTLTYALPCPNGTTAGAADLCFPLTDAGCPPTTFTTVGFIGRDSPVPNVCRACPANSTTFGFDIRVCRRIGFPCPKDHRQNSRGDCDRCPPDTRYDLRVERCVPCPSGSGSVGGLPLQCAPCSALILAEADASRCTGFNIVPFDISRRCPSGTYVLRRDSLNLPICSRCTKGTFSVGPDATECSPCPPGLVATRDAASACTTCPDGFQANEFGSVCIRNTDGCLFGTKDIDEENLCPSETCGNGDNSLSAVRDRVCGPCFAGTFSQQFQNSDGRCSECGIDELSDGKVCAKCPNGQVRDGLRCGCRGPLALERGLVGGVCESCPAGSFGQPGPDGDHTCQKCPAGTRYFSVGDSQVLGCFIAIRCRSFTDLCAPCLSGFFSSEPGSLACEECPEGTFTYGGESECLEPGQPSAPVPFNDAFGKKIHFLSF